VGDTVTVWRARVGVAVVWWEEDEEPLLVPLGARRWGLPHGLRKRIDDDGVGWYGAPAWTSASEQWAVGPFVTYERVSLSVDTETVLVGLALSFSY
jgi:hypothetical protein